jgi:hypothetical protein
MGRGGNSDNPFSSTGLDWKGNSSSDSWWDTHDAADGSDKSDSWGPNDVWTRKGLDSKGNRRSDKESKYSSEKTVLDKPLNASVARVRKTSAHAYEPDQWFRGPKEG